MMIVCVAIIGQQVRLDTPLDNHKTNQQNNPLCIECFAEGEDIVRFHYLVHCALDAVEEKGAHIHCCGRSHTITQHWWRPTHTWVPSTPPSSLRRLPT